MEITGIISIAVGLLLGYADLKGQLRNKNRVEILNWVLHSNSGMSLEEPAAKEFMRYFPPPVDEESDNLTHLTKNVMRFENGGILNASINYMRRDHTRTSHVATLEEIRTWTSKTPYPWIAWWVTLLGFIELVGNYFIEKKFKTA